MTEQTYYNDQSKKTESSIILRVDSLKKNYGIVLDHTIFYPEGGGQPGDTGFIGNARIIDTRKKDGEIYHITEILPNFQPGDVVDCTLDWERRYDYMQQHSGQHILSGVMHTLFKIATISVHQGEEYLTIETNREEIGEDEILAVENETNRIITQNIPINSITVDEVEARKMNLRRAPKVSGAVRLVQVGKYDIVACGGMHVSSSSEVRLISLIGVEKIRGHARLIWKVGDRALLDYREKTEIVNKLSELYSSPQNSIVASAIARAEQLRIAQQTVFELETTIIRLRVAELESQAVTYNDIPVIIGDFSAEGTNFLKNAVKNLPTDKPLVFCGIQKLGETELIWSIAANRENLVDFSAVRGKLFPLIDAKGGGKPPVWQGKGSSVQGIDQFLAEFVKLVRQG
ncbi:MAG: alanyl-tRNA editing protein [Bacteroidetes bacterium]|nr:alanyl-tRNA editing protein [Bacteroidota bacterium]